MKNLITLFAAYFAVAILSCSFETTVCSASTRSEGLIARIVPSSADGLARDLNGGVYSVYKRDDGYYVKQITYYFKLYPCNSNGCNYYFEQNGRKVYVRVEFN